MINVNHEEIETIIKNLKGEMRAVGDRMNELYKIQIDNDMADGDNIASSVDKAITELLYLYDDFVDAINEIEDAIEDRED